MQKVQKTLKFIRVLTYLMMTWVAVFLIVSVVATLFGIEISYKNGAFQTLGVTDLRPFTDRVMVAGLYALGPVILLAGAVQVVLFTECFGTNFVRRPEAAKFARNAGIITIIYAISAPLLSLAGYLLDVSLFIIRNVPWTAAARENVNFNYQGDVIVLSLMLALMFFLLSAMLKSDEKETSQDHFVAAE